MAAHMHDVSKALRRDHSNFGTVPLDDHICGNGGSMKHEINVAWLKAGMAADFNNAANHTLGLIRRRT